ncbi:unnamed protein product [Lampetra fluviatilis]
MMRTRTSSWEQRDRCRRLLLSPTLRKNDRPVQRRLQLRAKAEEEAAILGGAAATLPAAAILAEPRAARAAETGAPKASNSSRSHRLPQIKEFVAGGDWSIFTWRFEPAF